MHEGVGARRLAVVAGEQHLVDVEGEADRLAHLEVVERGLLDVHAEPDIGEPGLLRDCQSLRAAQRIGDVRRQRGEVELARAQCELRRLRVLDVADRDLREAGGRALVVRIAPQHDLPLLLERGDLHRAGADGLGVVLGAALLDGLLRDDQAGDVGERDIEERSARLVEHDAA